MRQQSRGARTNTASLITRPQLGRNLFLVCSWNYQKPSLLNCEQAECFMLVLVLVCMFVFFFSGLFSSGNQCLVYGGKMRAIREITILYNQSTSHDKRVFPEMTLS